MQSDLWTQFEWVCLLRKISQNRDDEKRQECYCKAIHSRIMMMIMGQVHCIFREWIKKIKSKRTGNVYGAQWI
jgi:hypothetical protein